MSSQEQVVGLTATRRRAHLTLPLPDAKMGTSLAAVDSMRSLRTEFVVRVLPPIAPVLIVVAVVTLSACERVMLDVVREWYS